MLSGGLFSALDAEGAFGVRPAPRRARAGFANISKGRPPAVLDPRVGVNTPLGDDSPQLPATQRGQAEPHVVRSIANPDVLLAIFQDGRFFDAGALDCGYALSRDGGLSWTRALIPNLTTTSGGRYNRATDPVAGAGPQGDLYLQTLVSVQGAFAPAALVVTRSLDGGNTWLPPATVFESSTTLVMPDKNWLAVNDYAGAPNAGRLVSTWTSFLSNAAGTALGNPVVASISDDRGASWSPPIEITPPGSSNQGTQPVFFPDGSLVIVYITFLDPNDVTRFNIECKLSSDGGRTFPAAATTVVNSVAGWDDPDLRDGIFLPAVAVARQTGDLLVTYTAVVNGSPRVLATKSSDRGITWSTPVIVSDQPAGVSVMNPAIAVTPDGRTVSVVFMDKRNASDGHNFVDHYAALSFDGGASWRPNLRLTEMSSDIRFGTPTSRGVMLGDYLGLAPSLASDQPCVAIWCDTRTGDADPFAVRFTPSADVNFQTWSVARFTRTQLNAGPLETADSDGDGYSNRAEFVLGTNPLVRESGEALFIRRPAAGNIDVLWTQRPDASVGNATIDVHVGAPTGPTLTRAAVLATTDLPPPTATGLAWRGERFAVSADTAVFAAHVPAIGSAMPEGTFATVNTNARLINLSTRGFTGTGASQLIVGFVINGNKSILVRAAGPALARFGVSGTLADPQLTLTALASDLVRSNDNWQQDGADAALFTRLGAFPFANNSLDAALVLQLGVQNYTAVVSGASNTTGISLVEVYDADTQPGAPANPRLLNLSTRGLAGTGDNTLIAGLVITGTQPRRVLIRAVGPGLTQFGVSGILADPTLTVFQGGAAIATNDDWEISRSGAAIAMTAQRVGAFALDPASLDAALLITLAPNAYTVVINGADGGTGIALVEVYDAD